MRRLTELAIASAALAASLSGGTTRADASTVPADDPCADASASNPADAAPAIDLQLPAVTLCDVPESGGGPRPTFAWLAVDGASLYALSVLDAAGEPIWAWTGPNTSIILGGWESLPAAEVPGALLSGPSTWFVVALDADWLPVAISSTRSIAP